MLATCHGCLLAVGCLMCVLGSLRMCDLGLSAKELMDASNSLWMLIASVLESYFLGMYLKAPMARAWPQNGQVKCF